MIKTVVEYTEPDNVEAERKTPYELSSGTFALQAHDPKSTIYYKI